MGCGGGGQREIVYLSRREEGVEVGERGRLYTYRGGNGVWRWGKREIVYLSRREEGVEVGERGRVYTYRGGNGVWRWGKRETVYLSRREEGVEVGKEGDCIPIAEWMGCGGGERGRLYTYRGGNGVWRWGKREIVYLSRREWGVEVGKEGDCIPIAEGMGCGGGERGRLYTYRGGNGVWRWGKRETVYLSRREEGVEVGKEGDCIPIAEGMGCGGGERGRLYTYHYAVTTRMTPAISGQRWEPF